MVEARVDRPGAISVGADDAEDDNPVRLPKLLGGPA